MRATTAFKHLLRLPGVTVTGVEFFSARVVVDVTLNARIPDRLHASCRPSRVVARAAEGGVKLVQSWSQTPRISR